MILFIMDKENNKLKTIQEEQKAKSRKKFLLNRYIDSLQNLDEKVHAIKLNQQMEKSSFISSFKILMKKK